jgi:transcriptional regulator with XRE-family HTH domain
MDFGSTIAKLRKNAGLSQQDVADGLEMARATYASIESGRRQPDLPAIRRIAEFYQIAPSDLVNGAVEPNRPVEPHLFHEQREDIKPREINPTVKPEKLREVLAYVLEKVGAKPNVGETVLYKLLYFIDFDYYEKEGKSITGLTYIHNHFGPSPVADFQSVVEGMKAKGELEVVETKYFKNTQKKYLPAKQVPFDELSARELEHINETLARLSDKTARELTELSHYDTPWVVARQGKPLDYRDTFYRTKLTAVTEPEDEL